MDITNIVLSAFLAFGQPVANTREVVRSAGLQAQYADGSLTLRMTEPVRRELAEAGGRHLVLESRDEAYPFFLTRHVVFRGDVDVAETWTEIRHGEEGPVRLLKMDSFAAELPGATNEIRVMTLAGKVQHEARVVESALACGQTLVTSSREGIHNAWESNPAMMVSFGASTESSGEVLGVALEWSGCSAKGVRRAFDGETSLFVGVDNQGLPYVLEPNVILKTPRAMPALSRKGRGEVSRQFHRWARRHLMPHGDDLHPVLLNSWEGSCFTFTERTLVEMMDGVKELGGEMFVLDDGWFGRGRYARDEINKDTSGLGDWVVNDRKLPHGLGWLADQARARGIAFGLWVEPEMVNTNSALAAAHPDWMLQEPKRRTLYGRGNSQNTLDLCNPKVRDFLFKTIDATYATVPALAYVKWDANGPISNLGSPSLPRDRQGNLWFDYTMGLYDLQARFQAKRPHVMTQACASGGGRMDFGFLRYADEFWASDRTDPVDRVFIQWGASQFYPASAMACHVTASPNHQTGRETPLKYRFDVAMSGRLGLELQPKDLSDDNLAYARARVAQYKRLRPVVQRGDLYRLASPYAHPYAALSYVSADRSRGVVFVYGLGRALDETVMLKLEGLDPARSYVDKAAIPGGFGDVHYKTTHLPLRKIPAACDSFRMGSPDFGEETKREDETPHIVGFTNDWYMAVYETTQRQYELVTGNNPSARRDEEGLCPVTNVSYADLRGSSGADWPTDGRTVGAGCFFGILRSRAREVFDLPTEAQWEYTCRAHTTACYNNNKDLTRGGGGAGTSIPEVEEVAWCSCNADAPHAVGDKLPNALDLYDMHGNVCELCRDWYAAYAGDAIDPSGPTSGAGRVYRGGSYLYYVENLRSARRGYTNLGVENLGFRVWAEAVAR